jgi:hypothetical protein
MDELEPEPIEPDDEHRGEGGKSGILGDSLRKALVTGLSAVFMTEEGIRGALSDMRLPKDAIGYLVQQTNNSRREVVRIVSDELKSFLRSADVTGAIRKALIGLRLEVKAEIRFVDDKLAVSKVETRQHDEPRHHEGGHKGRGRKKG